MPRDSDRAATAARDDWRDALYQLGLVERRPVRGWSRRLVEGLRRAEIQESWRWTRARRRRGRLGTWSE